MNQRSVKVSLTILIAELGVATYLIYLIYQNIALYIEESLFFAIGGLIAITISALLPGRWKLRIGLMVLATFLCLTGVELALHYTGPIMPDWQFEPLTDRFELIDDPEIIFVWAKDYKVPYTDIVINEQRLWDKRYTIMKPANAYRIVCIGDSTTVNSEHPRFIYPTMLEDKLNWGGRAEIDYQVINGAVTAYNAKQEVAFFKKYTLRFEPNLVIIGYCLNDPFARKVLWRKARFKTLRLFSLFYESFFQGSHYNYIKLHENKRVWNSVVVEPYRELAEICRQKEIPVIAFIFPLLEVLPGIERVYQQVTALQEELGFWTIDVHSGWSPTQLEDFRMEEQDEVHVNKKFHRLITRRIIALGLEKKIFPKGKLNIFAKEFMGRY